MATIGKIKLNCDISYAYNIFTTILTIAQCDFSKVILSFYFNELKLVDKILYGTDIEYIEGFTWEETSDIEKITDQKHLKNLLSFYICTDKFNISTSSLNISLLPEEFSLKKQDSTDINISKKMKKTIPCKKRMNQKCNLQSYVSKCLRIFQHCVLLAHEGNLWILLLHF